MNTMFQEHPSRGQRIWESKGTGAETALFFSVQAVMFVCIVLVAIQLIATA